MATLVAVNGQAGPHGDYIVPFTGAPAAGGETHLAQWQLDDLVGRGYLWADPTLAAEPSLADTLTSVTAELITRHDAAMAATEATLARVKALVAELSDL